MSRVCKIVLNLCQSYYPAVITVIPLQCSDSELLCGVKPRRVCKRNNIIHNEIYKINFRMIKNFEQPSLDIYIYGCVCVHTHTHTHTHTHSHTHTHTHTHTHIHREISRRVWRICVQHFDSSAFSSYFELIIWRKLHIFLL